MTIFEIMANKIYVNQVAATYVRVDSQNTPKWDYTNFCFISALIIDSVSVNLEKHKWYFMVMSLMNGFEVMVNNQMANS